MSTHYRCDWCRKEMLLTKVSCVKPVRHFCSYEHAGLHFAEQFVVYESKDRAYNEGYWARKAEKVLMKPKEERAVQN